MIYGLFQFYNDELTGWNRIVEFLKEDSHELVRKIAVVLDKQTSTPAHEKESNNFIDQFMVQEQQFDHIVNQITSQEQRLKRTSALPGKVIEESICQQQDSLRAKMQTAERNFMRTKYNCAIFLSTFLMTSSDKIKRTDLYKLNPA